jgi:hypothetical protein
MPKATWGAGNNPLTAEDLAGTAVPEQRTRYSGELPPAGTYRFTIQSLKKGIANSGNDKIVILALLDGSWRRNHKQYDGAPVFQHLAFTKANAENVAAFINAIGATAKDPYNSLVDEAGYITKFGSVGDPSGIQVYANVRHSTPTTEFPTKRLEVDYAGWMPVLEDDSDDAAGSADQDEEPPF